MFVDKLVGVGFYFLKSKTCYFLSFSEAFPYMFTYLLYLFGSIHEHTHFVFVGSFTRLSRRFGENIALFDKRSSDSDRRNCLIIFINKIHIINTFRGKMLLFKCHIIENTHFVFMVLS